MSNNEKTRKQLVDSMRKTKAGAKKRGTDIQPEPPAALEQQEKPAKKKTSSVKKNQIKKKTAVSFHDRYQVGRRVWPD